MRLRIDAGRAARRARFDGHRNQIGITVLPGDHIGKLESRRPVHILAPTNAGSRHRNRRDCRRGAAHRLRPVCRPGCLHDTDARRTQSVIPAKAVVAAGDAPAVGRRARRHEGAEVRGPAGHRPPGRKRRHRLAHRLGRPVCRPCAGWKRAVIGGDGGERYDGLQSREAPEAKFSEAVNAAIKELGLTRGRIGVGYLQDVVRLPEGGFNYTVLDP